MKIKEMYKNILLVVSLFIFTACGEESPNNQRIVDDRTVVNGISIEIDDIEAEESEQVVSELSTGEPDTIVWYVSNLSEFRQVLEDAATNGVNDKIILAKGTYNVTSDKLATLVFHDNEEYNLTIEAAEGLTSKDVILDGNNSTQVFVFNNTESSTLTLKGISIINGQSSSDGGGIYCNKHIVILNCYISNNSTLNNGGGFHFPNRSDVIIINSKISDNSALNNGGGFHFPNRSNVIILNSKISNNSAKNGGGFHSDSDSLVDIRNSTISNNNADNDGGGFHSDSVVVVWNSTISNNSAVSGAGFGSDRAIIMNSTFYNNSASTYGGSFRFNTINSLITNTTFIQNSTPGYGRGVFVNNIFDTNDGGMRPLGGSKIYNNYINNSQIKVDSETNIIKKNNLQSSDVGDVYLSDDNQTLEEESPVIDKGLNPSSVTYKTLIGDDDFYNRLLIFLQIDKVGNKRVHNGTIDMGAVEYGSTK